MILFLISMCPDKIFLPNDSFKSVSEVQTSCSHVTLFTQEMASQSWSMSQVTELLTSTAEITNQASVLAVLLGLLVMLVFLSRLIYQVR